MAVDVRTTLGRELTKLRSARAQIDRQVAALETALRSLGGRPEPRGARRRGMSVAAREAVGRRMRAYWADRRRARAERASEAAGASAAPGARKAPARRTAPKSRRKPERTPKGR